MTTKRSVSRWISDDQYVTEIFGTEGDNSADKRLATMTFTRESRSVTAVPDSMRDQADGATKRDNPR